MLVGSQIGGILGQSLGQQIGNKIGGKTGGQVLGDIGKIAGTAGGMAFPYFKKGGKVTKTGLAMVHKGEYVLPKGVKPTKAQKSAVTKGKKGKKM